MAKVGRAAYAASRARLEVVTADKTISKNESGELYAVDAGGALAITLPSDAESGTRYKFMIIDDVTGGPNILNPEQMANRTIRLLKDIKNDPKRLDFALKQIKRLKKATLVGSKEFSDEFTKVLDDLPKFDEVTPKTKVTKKTKTKATDLPLQQSKPNPKIWNDVESITDDTWKATGKVLNRIVIPDEFSVEAASAMGYDELLPKVIQIAKKN